MSETNTDMEYLRYLDFTPRRILEIGIGDPILCRTRPFWGKCAIDMVEPHPRFVGQIHMETLAYPNITVHPVVIADKEGPVTLYRFNNSTFTEGVRARRPTSRSELATHKVPCYGITLDMLDDGDFDIALIDIEAAEWWAVKHMVSRPKFMSLELYKPAKDGPYTHFHEADIRKWLGENNYKEVGRSVRDAFFARGDITPTA